MIQRYADISHFRAPYKNAMIAGFGAEGKTTMQGYGNDFAVPTDTIPTTQGKHGCRVPAEGILSTLPALLIAYNGVSLGSTPVAGTSVDVIKLEKFTPEQVSAAQADPEYAKLLTSTSAATFVGSQPADKMIFITEPVLAAIVYDKPLPADARIAAVPASSDYAKSMAQSAGMICLQGGQDTGFSLASMGPAKVVLGIALVGGIAYYIAKS